MNQQPTTGERVRLTTCDYEPEYRPGDRGKVWSGPHPTPSGGYYYLVVMDKDGPGGNRLVIHAHEIEFDS